MSASTICEATIIPIPALTSSTITDNDVMEVARAFVRIPPSGPNPHDQCRCSQEEQNGSGVDDRKKGEKHAAVSKAVRAANIILQQLTRPQR